MEFIKKLYIGVCSLIKRRPISEKASTTSHIGGFSEMGESQTSVKSIEASEKRVEDSVTTEREIADEWNKSRAQVMRLSRQYEKAKEREARSRMDKE